MQSQKKENDVFVILATGLISEIPEAEISVLCTIDSETRVRLFSVFPFVSCFNDCLFVCVCMSQ